jgi:hypothetical protein
MLHRGEKQIVTQKVSQIWNELSRRHPDRAEAIEALARRDSHFRSVCEDYGEAIRAVRRWAAAQDSTANKSDEFNRMAEEFRSEALEYLDRVARQ